MKVGKAKYSLLKLHLHPYPSHLQKQCNFPGGITGTSTTHLKDAGVSGLSLPCQFTCLILIKTKYVWLITTEHPKHKWDS